MIIMKWSDELTLLSSHVLSVVESKCSVHQVADYLNIQIEIQIKIKGETIRIRW